MNQLRAWLYGRDVQSRWPQEETAIKHQEDSVSRSISSQQQNSVGNVIAPDNFREMREVEVTESPIRHLLLKVVPLQPGDCLGCKLVGTAVMVVSGVIVLTSAIAGRARNPNLVGRKRLKYNIVCGTLFIGFEAAAVCRFFDLGPFGKIAQLQRQTYQGKGDQ